MINIRCEFCRSELNPLLLKQALEHNGELSFDVECINPECRKHNWVSKEFYLSLRKDYFKPYFPPLNNKFPSEMNVIFVSLNRHAISWIIRSLNQVHEAMFGKSIIFARKNAEIDTVIATRDRFPVPKGWNNVYDVSALRLLKKNHKGEQYDRVVLVQRPFNDMLKAQIIYLKAQKTGFEYIEKIINNLPEAYDKMYNFEDPKDHRFMRVSLNDLNNRTVDGYKGLMDFLNFPTFMRVPFIPIVPDRKWEVYSSVLKKDERLGGLLKRVKALVNEEDIYEEECVGKAHSLSNIEKGDILIIGSRFHKGNHPSENLFNSFRELGYETAYISCEMLGENMVTPGEYNRYLKRKELFPISKVLKRLDKKPKLIFIDQIGFAWLNDVNIPVLYLHSFFKRQPYVFHPDVVFFRHEPVRRFFELWYASLWYEKVRSVQIMPIAVDPNKFKLAEKKYKGIYAITGRENLHALKNLGELISIGLIECSLNEKIKYKELGLNFIDGVGEDGGITDEEFRELLPQLEALWVHLPRGQYVSRRMLEAMICNTICVMKIEDEQHEHVLREMGLIAGEHYIKINKLEDMIKLNKKWNINKYENMIKKARELILEKHTYKNRALQILETYQNEMWLK